MENSTELVGLLNVVIEQNQQLLERLRTRAEMPAQEWFSIGETAALIGTEYDHVYRAVKGSVLPASNVGGFDRATYRISRKDIEQWMERTKTNAMPPPRKKEDRPILPVSRHLPRSRQDALKRAAG